MSVDAALKKCREAAKAVYDNSQAIENSEFSSMEEEAELLRQGKFLPTPVVLQRFEESFEELRSELLREPSEAKPEKGKSKS